MIDLKIVREHPDLVREAVRKKHEKGDVDGILQLDQKRRQLLTEMEKLKADRNRASEKVAELKRSGQDATSLISETRAAGDRIRMLETEVGSVEADLGAALEWLPNLPAADVPDGEDATANRVVREWGKKKEHGFPARTHVELGDALGILDLARGGKVTGSGFFFLKGAGARLERTLIQFMLDLHTREHGYREIQPPYLVNRASMRGTGQVPKLEDDMFRCDRDPYFLIPTAEVPLTNFLAGEEVKEEDLPVWLVGASACFRREAGAHGKDTAGMVRVHQFQKVELLKFVAPETSAAELEALTANAETVLQKLGLHYRVVLLCSGDLSFASAKTYDLEVWAPGLGRWLEVSSCSNFLDFQARRAGIRLRRKSGPLDHVHTLNGSGLGLPRVLIAVLEHYQQADGSIAVPEALRDYMDGVAVIKTG